MSSAERSQRHHAKKQFVSRVENIKVAAACIYCVRMYMCRSRPCDICCVFNTIAFLSHLKSFPLSLGSLWSPFLDLPFGFFVRLRSFFFERILIRDSRTRVGIVNFNLSRYAQNTVRARRTAEQHKNSYYVLNYYCPDIAGCCYVQRIFYNTMVGVADICVNNKRLSVCRIKL